MTAHAIQDDGTIREIYKVTGGPYGGIYVNQQFESLLDELFGTQMLQSYRQQFPSDWICLKSEFEGKKRGKRILDSSLMTNIRLPKSFVSQIIQTRGTRIDRYGEREVKIKNNEYLALSSAIVRKLFTPVVDNIKKHLSNLLRKSQLKGANNAPCRWFCRVDFPTRGNKEEIFCKMQSSRPPPRQYCSSPGCRNLWQ